MKRQESNEWWDAVVVCFMVVFIWGIILLACITVIDAQAQTGGYVYSQRGSTQPHGEYIVGWNATGATIYDGTVVMADTMTASASVPQVVIGKGFRTWDGNVNNIKRVLGVLLGTCPGNSQARIMVRGFHNNVKVDSTAYIAYMELRPSLTNAGSLARWTVADSSRAALRPWVGTFQRYASIDSLRAWAWIDFGVR